MSFKFIMLLLIFSIEALGQVSFENLEPYSNRPDVLQVKAVQHQMGEQWDALKLAQISFLAQVLELYSPDTQIYFLARDSEYLYDLARLITDGTDEAERVHLLNVSRQSSKDVNLKAYLEQNGISEAALKDGKKIVFVDTGYEGSISLAISKLFPEALWDSLKTHLIVSGNHQHPSSRSFLIHLDELANLYNVASMHDTVVEYEGLSHFTHSSSLFLNVDGVYEPFADLSKRSKSGRVSEAESLRLMQDLRFYWNEPSVKRRFQAERKKWKDLIFTFNSGSADEVRKIRSLISEKTMSARVLEAGVRDLIETKENSGMSFSYALEDFGLKERAWNKSRWESLRLDLMLQHPEWAFLINDPELEIYKLFENQKWDKLAKLVGLNIAPEINEFLFEFLFAVGSSSDGVVELRKVAALSRESDLIQLIVKEIFATTQVREHKSLLEDVIREREQQVLGDLAEFVFSQPHTEGMTDLLKLMIERADQKRLGDLAEFVFSQPHTANMTDLLELMIERADQQRLEDLAKFVFSKPHAESMRPLVDKSIEKGGQRMLTYLRRYTTKFSALGRLSISVLNQSLPRPNAGFRSAPTCKSIL